MRKIIEWNINKGILDEEINQPNSKKKKQTKNKEARDFT